MIKYKHAPLITFKLCVGGEKPLKVHDKDGHKFIAYQAIVNYDGSIDWSLFATNT